MRRWLLLLCLLTVRPLAAVTPYQYGQLPTSAADADLTNAYNTWKSRHLKSITCGSSMAWVDNGSSQALSEGMGYGMLMAAYLDTDDTGLAALDRFYTMKKDSHGLMDWRVPGDCSGDNGANAATDGDLDVALAYIRASRRWPANGWNAKATAVLNNIYANMVDGCQGLKNGDTWGGCSSGANNAYNPSYFRTAYMGSFNCFEGGTRWTAVHNRSYNLMGTAYSNYALAPDWVRNDGSYGQATNSGGYGYDACRTPWTFAQDYLWWGNASGQNWGGKIGRVFGNKAGGWSNPASAASDVGDDYNYSNGSKVSSNHENAFLGGAAVAFMATTYTAQLNAFYSNLVFNDNNSYFSDSLKVIYLMILTGAFQEPCYGPGPIPTATPTATPTNYAGTPTQTPQPAFGLIFEDFENGLAGGYAYGTGVTQARVAGAAKNGAYGYQVTGANLAGGGVGFNSSYANGQGVINAAGAVSLRFWVNSNVNTSFQVDWYEAGNTTTAVAGGDGEAWVSSTINVTGGSGWQQIVVPLSSLTEELYNGTCNPTYATPGQCGTTGNNTQNLTATNKIQIKFTLGSSATVNFDDFQFVLGVQPSPTFTRTPFIGSYNQVFDDIESPLSLKQTAPVRAGTFADTAHGASASLTTSTSMLPPGGGNNTTSGALTYNTGGASSYGVGAFFLSPYGTPQGYVDASGAVFLGLWLYTPAPGLVYQMEFTEAGNTATPVAGADGEAWQSSNLVSQGGWEFVQLEVGSFTEDPYNPTCNPTSTSPSPCLTGAHPGNGIMDFQAISTVQIKLAGNQGSLSSGTLYFDDVVFVTSFKTPTPTQTLTIAPATATSTRTQTPSATSSNTMTPSPTASPTPSASPSNSPSQTPSITPSFSASPTPTNYAGSPTNTPFFSATPTTSPSSTLTLTYSLTATPTASPSNTPLLASSTATPSITWTWTAAPTNSFTQTKTATPSSTVAIGTPTQTVTPGWGGTPYVTTTWVPTPIAFTSTIYEDFESGSNFGPDTASNGGGSYANKTSGADPNSAAPDGTKVGWIEPVMSGTDNNLDVQIKSNYAPVSTLVMDESGATYVSLWVYLTHPLQFKVGIREYQGPSGGAANERYFSPWILHDPSTAWQQIVLPLSSFSKDYNDPNCAPNCYTTGNGVLELNKVYSVDLDFLDGPSPGGYSGYPSYDYVDRIQFLKTAATATATPSATPSATPTPMIQDLAFTWTPNQLTVTAGTTVTWGWVGTHDVRSDTSLFSSGPAATGGSFQYTFSTPGTYRYYCGIHGGPGGTGMSGIIFVLAPTPTPTSVISGGNGDQVIITSKPFPNPMLGSGSLRVQLAEPVDGLTGKFYSRAMVAVGSLETGALPAGWVDLAVPASVTGQAPGIYFYVLTAKRNGQSLKAPKSGRLVLLH
jgi:plastocyanin